MYNLSADQAGYGGQLFFPPAPKMSTGDPYAGYWVASLSGMGNLYVMIATDDGNLGDNLHGYYNAEGVGLRPTIVVPTDKLGEAGVKVL